MGSKVEETWTLLLRIFVFCCAVASSIVLFTDIIKSFDDLTFVDVTLKDVTTYRYVFATAVIAAAYALLQIPLAIYAVSKGKRMISGGFLQEYDFYADNVISLLLATGSTAGFSVTYELQQYSDILEILGVEKLFRKVCVASGLLSGALICMVVLSVLSSSNRNEKKGLFG